MSQLTRLGALVATGALTATGLVASVTAPAQAVGTDARPATIGATWLEGQLTNGIFHYPDSGYGAYNDYGLSLDAGLSLVALGGHDAEVSTISDSMASAVGADHYITGEEFGDTGSTYAGAVAKAAVFAKAAGDDPASFGGVDLVSRLEAQVRTASPNEGRLFDTSTSGDYANTLGQAFAANALSAASSSEAASVIDFLLDQQCSAGFFRLSFSAEGAADQTCDAATSPSPDTDATAMAVLQLSQVASPTQAVSDAIDQAEAWLLGAQHADGSFGGGASTEAANTNSTGLAGWALGELGDDAAATKAATWVRSHQIDEQSACPSKISDQTGALGYDDAAVAAGRADGITLATLDQWRRSTAPTLPVLQWAPAASSALSITGPTGYLKAGSVATYRVSGAAPGDKVCVSGIGSSRRVVAPASGSFAVALTMPSATATRVATAAVHGSSDSLLVQVLGARKLTVTPAHRTKHRGTKLRVVVSGLAPGEHVRLRYRGVTKRTGLADPTGHFTRVIRVGHKLGKARIVAWGEFSSIRHGRAVIRVVR
ncbi:MAG TPA: hypothetical protein VFE07_13350 [Marmoricola sp.]|nr:hypothetical protein [Marmoricola sp.]